MAVVVFVGLIRVVCPDFIISVFQLARILHVVGHHD